MAKGVAYSACQANLTRQAAMQLCSTSRSTGVTFLSSGVAFMALALLADQQSYLGVATSMLALGVVFLARKRNRP